MSALHLVDANVIVGPRTVPVADRDDSLDSLLSEMDRCGIARACVTHIRSLEYDPATGNEQLLREISGHAALLPVWVLLPAGSGEMPPPVRTLTMLRDAQVSLVRFYPGRHNYSASEWNLGDWCDALGEHRVPTLWDVQDTGLDALYPLAQRRPGWPVILTGVGYRADRSLMRFLEHVSNAYLEISSYKVHLGLERLVERFGAHRLVFGTGMMEMAPGAAVGTLLSLRVSDADRQTIAARTLERLLEQVSW